MKCDLHLTVRIGNTSGRKSPSSCGSQQSKVAPKPGGVQIILWLFKIRLLAERRQQRGLAEKGRANLLTHYHQDVYFSWVFITSEQQSG